MDPILTHPKALRLPWARHPLTASLSSPSGEEEREGKNLSGKSDGKVCIREICKCSRKKLLNKILMKSFLDFFFFCFKSEKLVIKR